MACCSLSYSPEDPGSLVESCRKVLEWILRTHQGGPIRRCWIDSAYTEEELTLLEEEVLPAMARFLERVGEIEGRLEAAQEEGTVPRPCGGSRKATTPRRVFQ